MHECFALREGGGGTMHHRFINLQGYCKAKITCPGCGHRLKISANLAESMKASAAIVKTATSALVKMSERLKRGDAK
jgi:hypothetical protein